MTYSETIQYLYDCLPVFHQVGGAAYKPGLDNTIRLMNVLNNPQSRFKSIHVAGTNGKGSVSHMLAAILQSAGYKVGLYTSPHLVDFGERIRVNGKMIDKLYVINFVESNKTTFEEIQPSFFEVTMAMAFAYFADCEVDVAIVEVGLGGRLDSTNIIQPELSVITNISFDHVGFLGNTLEKIAFEKAGIIKSNTPVVIGEVLSETKPVFESKAKQENAPIWYAEEQLKVLFKAYHQYKMIVETSDNKVYTVGLSGTYQLKNIATTLTVIAKLNKLDFNILDTDLRNGLENVCELTGLEGRWQKLGEKPVIIADTGHNVAGISYVVEQLKTQNYKNLRIIIGMVNDKDITEVLKLLPTEAKYYFTQAQIERALAAEILLKQAETIGLNGDIYSSVESAIKSAIADSETTDLIFIGGSNFVVGEALEYFKINQLYEN
ncbi:MAG: folylpolyglutamate synthase/dihydrofolate synthase family protein [Paludibacter sp.]